LFEKKENRKHGNPFAFTAGYKWFVASMEYKGYLIMVLS